MVITSGSAGLTISACPNINIDVTSSSKINISSASVTISSTIDPSFNIMKSGSSSSYFQIRDASAQQARIQKVAAEGAPDLLIDPIATDGTSAASIRLFRLTNTTANSYLALCIGANSATENARISGSGNTSIATNNGDLTLSRTTGKIGFYGHSASPRGAHIVDASGTLADVTTKFNTLLLFLEEVGLLATS